MKKQTAVVKSRPESEALLVPNCNPNPNPAIRALVLAVAWGGLSETFAAFLISRVL